MLSGNLSLQQQDQPQQQQQQQQQQLLQQQQQPLGHPEKNWQDEFRSLLPNINISFANSYSNWQKQQSQAPSQPLTATQPTVNAPPGLAQFPSDASKALNSGVNPLGWMSAETPQQPPGFTSAARRPPPGFGNLSAAQPQYPSSVSSVINPLLTADLTAGKSFLQQSATNMPR